MAREQNKLGSHSFAIKVNKCKCRVREKWCTPLLNNLLYYTSQAVREPITKINQSKCSIAGQYSLSIGPGTVPNGPE